MPDHALQEVRQIQAVPGRGSAERAWIPEEDPPFKTEAGDPYYLVLAKKRIIGVYNRKYYEFEGGEQ